jgi:hypothetical protein
MVQVETSRISSGEHPAANPPRRETIGQMNSAFAGQFLSTTALMFVAMSIGDVWHALRKQPPPRPRPEWSKRIPQPVVWVILCAVPALIIYWDWPSPEGWGFIAGAFLSMPVKSLIGFIRKRAAAR